MFGSKKKREEEKQKAAEALNEEIQMLAMRGNLYKEEYRNVLAEPDVGARYLHLKALVGDIEQDMEDVSNGFYDHRKFKKFRAGTYGGLGGTVATMAITFPLEAAASFWTFGLSSIAATLYCFRQMTNVENKQYQARRLRKDFYASANQLVEEIKQEIYALPARDPAGFAKSAHFDEIADAEPYLLKTFNRAAQRIARQNAAPKPRGRKI